MSAVLVPPLCPAASGAVDAALVAADAVDGLGRDVPATIAWAVDVGRDRPESLAASWDLLAAVAARDVAAARMLEPHLDALGILDQARRDGIDVDLDAVDAGASSSWGVYAAEGPGVRLEAVAGADGWTLTGTKPWCSLAADLSHALVTAWVSEDERRLFALDLRAPGVLARTGPWHARGLRNVVSAPVDLSGARAVPVGEAGWYLDRPGFAHGGVGVAACWWGGAFPLRDALRTAAASERADQLARVHLGRADTALWAAGAVLRDAAAAFEAGTAAPGLLAARARTVIADAVETVLAVAARALGPLPLVADEAHARRVADLQVYVRQHHAERDLDRIGRDILRAESA